MNIWDIMYETFKFKKDEIKLIELFSGIGSQAVALGRLADEFGFNLNVLGVSEIDKYAIQSYNAIHGDTHNFGNICDIKELPYTDILTYSFPCQDISLAGKGKGFTKGSGTRSGLLWEVERILEKQQEIGKLPQVLLMENVKALAGKNFKDDFIQWQLKLQELGYYNYWEILNAKDYGIPQNRERVFMVSILGEYSYSFPKKFPLKLRLKDMLEDEVDDKFYLSDKMMEYIVADNEKWSGNNDKSLINKSVASAINTGEGSRRCDASNYVSDNIEVIGTLDIKGQEHTKRVLSPNGISPTITTMSGGNHEPKIQVKDKLKIINNTKKGYLEAKEGDGIVLNQLTGGGGNNTGARGRVQKQKAPTVMTSGMECGVVVNPLKGKSKNGWHFEQQVYDENGITRSVKAGGGSGNIPKVINNLKIRKLTPKECWRLMGFSDEHFAKAEQVCSNSQLYKQAGNSIVVDVLYYIFKELF